MSDLSKQVLVTPPLTDMSVMAHLWIARGYKVLPAQYDSKALISGFGPYLKDLATAEDIEVWLRLRRCNLAVLPPEDGLILDFDDAEVYNRFLAESPEAASSYTEKTPHGFHVFLAAKGGKVPKWGELVPGLELKRICIGLSLQGPWKAISAGQRRPHPGCGPGGGFEGLRGGKGGAGATIAPRSPSHGQPSGEFRHYSAC